VGHRLAPAWGALGCPGRGWGALTSPLQGCPPVLDEFLHVVNTGDIEKVLQRLREDSEVVELLLNLHRQLTLLLPLPADVVHVKAEEVVGIVAKAVEAGVGAIGIQVAASHVLEHKGVWGDSGHHQCRSSWSPELQPGARFFGHSPFPLPSAPQVILPREQTWKDKAQLGLKPPSE